MSSPSGRSTDGNGPSSFAPEPIQDSVRLSEEQFERLKEAVQAIKRDTRSKGFDELRQNVLSQSDPFNSSDEGVETDRFRRPRSFGPSGPLPLFWSRSPKIKWWHLTSALVSAVFIVVSDPWDIWTSGAEKSGSGSYLSRSLSLAQERIEPANRGVAKLIVNEATPSPVDQPVPLGVSVHNANDGDFLVVSGFTKGTALSAGRPVGDSGWSLYARDINDAVIRPPPHLIGVMEVTVVLVAAPEFTILESRPLRFEWVAEKVPEAKVQEGTPPEEETLPEAKVQAETPPEAKVQEETPPEAKVQAETPPEAKVQAETPPEAKVQEETRPEAKLQEETRPEAKVQEETRPQAALRSQTIRQLSPEETAAMLKRGNELVVSGDLAAARLVLRGLVEAGNARAAFVLAGTYDPMTLEKLQVHGLSPDLAMARHWYEKAKELGSPDALRELQMLDSKPN
jgi:outer membrane biosynthesis protein TonB